MTMDLCIYTDSVADLGIEEMLDFAVEIGARAVEIAAGGQSSAPHMRVFELLESPEKLDEFASRIERRGLRLAAVNCSAWPMHPRFGTEHERIMRAAVEVAERLGVRKIVTMSGCPGDGPGAATFNWITYPWPPDAIAIREQQWDTALRFWEEFTRFAAGHGVEQIALELHPLHLAFNVPTLLHLRERVGPIVGANVDPSHMFWQHVDPITAVHALGSAVQHVHLKDVEFNSGNLAVAGVLDTVSFDRPAERAWIFRTVGQGHGREFWAGLFDALTAVGYDDVVSIENEDPIQPAREGVAEAAELALALLQRSEMLGVQPG